MSWQEIAKELRNGSRRKVKHCGNDPSAYVWSTAKGVHLKCFRCQEYVFEAHKNRTLHDIVRFNKEAYAGIREIKGMPADAVHLDKAPDAALAWLLKGGLLPDVADKAYGMRWHDTTKRVLIPIYTDARDQKLSGILGRAVFNERPKYIMLQGKPSIFFQHMTNDTIVLVEDVLSAIAVARAGVSSAAALGTSITLQDAAKIAGKAQRVVVWTDPDKAGQVARAKLLSKLELVGADCFEVFSDVDPKLLTSHEIFRAIVAAERSKRI